MNDISELAGYMADLNRKAIELDVLKKSQKEVEHKLSISEAKRAQLIESNIELKNSNREMDKELDIVHECLTELYDYNLVYPIVKACLYRIEKEVDQSKSAKALK